LETARDRLGALPGFHKSHDALRLFARILRDVWEQQSNVHWIPAHDLDWVRGAVLCTILMCFAPILIAP